MAIETSVDDVRALLGKIDAALVVRVPYAFARSRHVLVAFRENERAVVLCTGSPEFETLTELRRRIGMPLVFKRVESADFESLLRQAYDRSQSAASQMVDDLGEGVDLDLLAHDVPEATDLLAASDEAPVIRLINALLTEAIREDASDIHLEAFEQRSVVRFRVDGVLKDVVEPQRALHNALVSRLKIMANLKIDEKRLPQDGRISLRVGDRPIDVRVSCLPTRHGERIVLRLLDKQSSRLDLERLGMPDNMRSQFDRLIRAAHGIILVTGPTGSGKTTTLYSGISRLDRDRLNILTVEDPVEFDLDGVGQTQVHAGIGLTFASGLRSILRQDPDVILIGEIRDFETAEIAVQASLTGHLVLSTLHTNSAVGAVTRLIDMGVEPFLISSSLLAVLAQRLVRRLCPNCKVADEPDDRERALLGEVVERNASVYRPTGCEQCDFSGYRGRLGIFELLRVDDAMKRLIHDRASETDMLDVVRRQSPSLLDDGIAKIRQGATTFDEVLRVTQDAT
ncbi:MAG: type II secretion system protein GspE [Proteobacteria bacterium]|nr:MAG: type II secretion system protein GspE [Pseudomonadota bacterium]